MTLSVKPKPNIPAEGSRPWFNTLIASEGARAVSYSQDQLVKINSNKSLKGKINVSFSQCARGPLELLCKDW